MNSRSFILPVATSLTSHFRLLTSNHLSLSSFWRVTTPCSYQEDNHILAHHLTDWPQHKSPACMMQLLLFVQFSFQADKKHLLDIFTSNNTLQIQPVKTSCQFFFSYRLEAFSSHASNIKSTLNTEVTQNKNIECMPAHTVNDRSSRKGSASTNIRSNSTITGSFPNRFQGTCTLRQLLSTTNQPVLRSN
jgi:hypothetical protein